MSKMIIIEGNSNDKDNVRAYMVKGEKGDDGISPTIEVERNGDGVDITATDGEGTTTARVDDGVSPIITVSKTDGVTTINITDIEGIKTATINDGEVTTAMAESIAEDKVESMTVNNLTSTATDKPLSAYQGNVLAEAKVNKSNIAIVTDEVTVSSGSEVTDSIVYPTWFTNTNSIMISAGIVVSQNMNDNYYIDSSTASQQALTKFHIYQGPNYLHYNIKNESLVSNSYTVKIVLYKFSDN